MTGTVLILGANGRFGRNAAEAFWNAGWQVRTFVRDEDDLNTAAQGVDLIVNGWNPAYPDWERLVPDLTQQVIAAAQSSSATVLIPGNVYGYGGGSGPVLSADTPKRARNKLGQIRNQMEEAYRQSGVRTIILRAGDFIDTEASGNWFEGHIAANVQKGYLKSPGDAEAVHAWAYLPDMAQAAVMLAERREFLSDFEEVLFPGYALSLNDIAAIVGRLTNCDIQIKRFPWWMIRMLAPFWPMGRHLLEIRYLWSMPHLLDGARFNELFPIFRATDPTTAIARSLRDKLNIHPNQSMPRRGFNIPAE